MRISYLEFRRVLFRSWRTGPTSARLAGNAAISLDHLLQIATQAGWIEPGTVQRQRRAIRLHQYGADTVRRGRAADGQPAVDEVGRAECRENGCKFGVISGVARS